MTSGLIPICSAQIAAALCPLHLVPVQFCLLYEACGNVGYVQVLLLFHVPLPNVTTVSCEIFHAFLSLSSYIKTDDYNLFYNKY